MRVLTIFIVLFYSIHLDAQSQDGRKALDLIKYKDYAKAEQYLDTLFTQDIKTYFDATYKVKIELFKYEEAIEVCKKAQKEDTKESKYYFFEGKSYNFIQDSLNASKAWAKANKTAKNNFPQIDFLIKKYKELYKWGQIISLYQLSNEPKQHEKEYLNALLQSKNLTQATEYIIKSVNENDDYMKYVFVIEPFKEDKKVMRKFEKSIYSQLSKNPNSDKWNEICIWSALLVKDYEYALTLSKAYHKRNPSKISKVWEISSTSLNQEDYETSLNGYKYIHKVEKNKNQKARSLYYAMNSMYLQLEGQNSIDSSLIDKLETEFVYYYDSFNQFNVVDANRLYADFLFKYKSNIDSAISVTDYLLSYPRTQGINRSHVKMSKADYLLAKGEIWEASLLYGQVGKTEKDNPLGELARFKNSKVFYYSGDYDLAEELLSILKSSTTELIANDALNLAVFIQENRDGDTFELAMKEVSQAELFLYQKKVNEAFEKLNFLLSIYPNSKLVDDVLLLKAQYYSESRLYSQAINDYDKIIANHKASILVDRAMMEKAVILEDKLDKPDEAKKIYLKLMTDYQDSVFIVEARKRYRAMNAENM